MAEPTPGRPGGGSTAGGPTSATAATFVVNDKSLRDLHTIWRSLIQDVKDFNKELAKLGGGGAKNVDLIRAKLGGLSIGGGSGGGGSVVGTLAGGSSPWPSHMPAVGAGRTGAHASSIPGLHGQEYQEAPPSGGGGNAGTGGTEALAGGSSPWKRRAEIAGAVAGSAALFYARRMDDITDADLYFNQQAQNTGGGYNRNEKGQARNALFSRPGGGGFGGGVRGYQSVQDLLGGARGVFAATGGSVGQTNSRGMYANGRGMEQLRAAGQLAVLNPDMGLTASGAAVGSLYDPTTSARMASMGMGPSVGMRGQLQTPQAIYQSILQRVYRGRKPTARMITEGLQPGANLYMTLTEGMGLTPDAIEQFSRYAIAQANLGGNVRDTNRAIDLASRGNVRGLSKADKSLLDRSGLEDNIRTRRNELGGAQARQTIEAGREAENALLGGFSALADATDVLTNTFKRLNDVTMGHSGQALGGVALASGGISAALNAVGGVGGALFAYQAGRQMLGRGAGGAARAAGSAGRGAGAAVEGVAGTAEGAAGFAARAGGFLGKWGTRALRLPLPALGSKVYSPEESGLGGVHKGRDGKLYTDDGYAIKDGKVNQDDFHPDEVRDTPNQKPQSLLHTITGHFARGGVVPGNHNRDDVDIKATPGEVVVPKTVVHLHGGADSLMRKLGFRGRGRGGHYAEGGEVTGDTQGLNPDFLKRLKAWSAAVGQPFNVGSGYRSIAEQKVLYDRWMRRVPGQAKAAKPGSSNHNYGLAADGPRWGDKHPEKFGLRYPMSFEPWHVEPANAKAMRGGAAMSDVDTSASDGAAPTTSPSGGGYVTAPRTATDEKSAFAAWIAKSNTMYGVNETPSATGATSPTSGGTDATQPTATTNTAPSDPSGNAKLGQQKAAARGWTGSEWDALYNLFQKESGWRTDAANSSSSARGIAQTMMSVHFGKNWQKSKDALDFMRDPSRQIDWGLNYIAQRYTTPSKAWAHSQKFNWYDMGAWQTENETAVLHKDEMVVPAGHARKLRSLLNGQRNQSAMAQPSSYGVSSGGSQRPISISLSMPIQLIGKATVDDARELVGMVRDAMQEDTELAKMGTG